MSAQARTNQITASRDQVLGTIDLIGWRPGPAGLAQLDFNDGAISLLVDAADPSVFCALHYEDAAPGIGVLLDEITGGNGDRIARRIERLGDKPQIVFRTVEARQRNTSWADRLDRAASTPFSRMARLAVLLSEIDDRSDAPGVATVGRLEAALTGLHLPAGLAPVPAPNVLLAEAAARLETLFDQDELDEEIPESSTSAIAEMLHEAAALIEEIDALLALRLTHLGTRFIQQDARRFEIASMVGDDIGPVRSLDLSVAPSEDLKVTLTDLPGLEVLSARLDRPEATVTLVSAYDEPGEPSFDATALASRCWLRLFTPGTWNGPTPNHPLLVAMAPFAANAFGSLSAVALVPDRVDASTLSADVTTQPAAAPPLAVERSIRAAVRVGQLAARRERVGDKGAAADLWRTCETAWRDLDDQRRARLAVEHARSARDSISNRFATGRVLEPFAFDAFEAP